jgi:hypothetical protein
MEKTYYSAVETAKLIRVALKRAFPSTRFSVRCHHGSSVDIRWTDGPSDKRVKAVTDAYEGKGFDGMIDLQYSYDTWIMPDGTICGTATRGTTGSRGTVPAHGLDRPHPDARLVHFSTYVFTRRNISPAFANKLIPHIAKYWGGIAEPLPVAIDGYMGYTFADSRMLYEPIRSDLDRVRNCWAAEIHRAAEDRTAHHREDV